MSHEIIARITTITSSKVEVAATAHKELVPAVIDEEDPLNSTKAVNDDHRVSVCEITADIPANVATALAVVAAYYETGLVADAVARGLTID